MIKSMTGFAVAAVPSGSLTVSAEIRTYNSRNLDVALRLASAYAGLEERIRGRIAERLTRGRVEAKIQIEDAATDTAGSVAVDLNRAKAVRKALEEMQAELGLKGSISMELLLAAGGILKTTQPEADLESVWPVLEQCLEQALTSLDIMRTREGTHLAVDLSTRLDMIAGSLQDIRERSEGLSAAYQERLKERIMSLTQGLIEIDPARLAQEAAFLADRSDISEEIVRAESHLLQFRAIMGSGEAAGRKLNFLLQELNREFTTMGSKVANAAAAQVVVEVKTELEKIREQVQNVE
jgi:uncharacterized protein (TIGR00255 family)